MSFKRVFNPGTVTAHNDRSTPINVPVYLDVEIRPDGELSIRGVIGPRANGSCWGAGQIDLRALTFVSYGAGWTAGSVERLASLWAEWHLNHKRAGCVHQRATWDLAEQIEVREYVLTSEARRMRSEAKRRAVAAAVSGETCTLDETEKALLTLESAYGTTHQPPDSDSPLSGCYEVRKREMKAAGWVTPSEHSRGLLTKPCAVCGYRYGSAWLKEELPQSIIDELEAMPAVERASAWRA